MKLKRKNLKYPSSINSGERKNNHHVIPIVNLMSENEDSVIHLGNGNEDLIYEELIVVGQNNDQF